MVPRICFGDIWQEHFPPRQFNPRGASGLNCQGAQGYPERDGKVGRGSHGRATEDTHTKHAHYIYICILDQRAYELWNIGEIQQVLRGLFLPV